MRKNALACLMLGAVVSTHLFAYSANIKWSWTQNDPRVTAFRYQIDAQEDEGWTEVVSRGNGSTYSAEAEFVEFGRAYVLFLQQSYDGVHWSPSKGYPFQATEPEEGDEFVLADDAVSASAEELASTKAAVKEEKMASAAAAPAPAPAPVQQAPAEVAAEEIELDYDVQAALDEGLGYINSNGELVMFEDYGTFEDDGSFVPNEYFDAMTPEEQAEFEAAL